MPWVDIVHSITYQGPGLRMVLVSYAWAVTELLCKYAQPEQGPANSGFEKWKFSEPFLIPYVV